MPVIAHADLRGDSYQLSKSAAERTDCEAIVFCGVHFMAETADILVNRPEQMAGRNGSRVNVVLPDTAAGCSMADMAAIEQVEDAWADLGEIIDTDDITPVTLYQLCRQPEGFLWSTWWHCLHIKQCSSCSRMGFC
jgi:quinolinate synthase